LYSAQNEEQNPKIDGDHDGDDDGDNANGTTRIMRFFFENYSECASLLIFFLVHSCVFISN